MLFLCISGYEVIKQTIFGFLKGFHKYLDWNEVSWRDFSFPIQRQNVLWMSTTLPPQPSICAEKNLMPLMHFRTHHFSSSSFLVTNAFQPLLDEGIGSHLCRDPDDHKNVVLGQLAMWWPSNVESDIYCQIKGAPWGENRNIWDYFYTLTTCNYHVVHWWKEDQSQ